MKKLLALVLAMMLAVPVLSLAEDITPIGGADAPTDIFVAEELLFAQTPAEQALAAGRRVTTTASFTEVSGVDSVDEAMDDAMEQLLEMLSVSFAQQGDEVDFALQINGTDALTLGGAVNGSDIYIESNLIGGAVVVGLDEVEGLIDRLLAMMVNLELMTEEDVEMLRSELESMGAMYAQSAESSMDAMLTLEDVQSFNYTALESLLTLITEKIVPVEEIVVPRMCDPAVSGEKAVLTNADMVAGMKCVYQFIQDNPKLMNYLGYNLGYYTEEEIALLWETSGEFYTAFNLYADYEEFRADYETFPDAIQRMQDELDAQKFIDGEIVFAAYYDEAGLPVYVTMDVPVFVETESLYEATAAEEVKGETSNVNLTYTRQTVAGGVAHTCNIFVNDSTLTIDALVAGNTTTINMTDDSSEYLSVKIETTPSETEEGVKLIQVTGELKDGQDLPVMDFVYQGSCADSENRTYMDGTLTLTSYEYPAGDMVIEAADAETGTVEATVTAQTEAMEPVTSTIVIEFDTETIINGVDFTDTTHVAIKVDGTCIALQFVTASSEPEESIMAGEVVRPAELDDAAFANWFVGAYSSLSSWYVNLMTALPEDVLAALMGL